MPAYSWNDFKNGASWAVGKTKQFFTHPYYFWTGVRDAIAEWLLDGYATPSNNQDSLKSIPTLAGAKNQSGYNTVIPITLGKHRYTPRYCAQPYHTISGEDGEEQTFHGMYMLGYNNVKVTDFKLGSIDLAHNEDYIKAGLGD